MVNRLCEGRLYAAAGRLTAQNGGARPGQDPEEQDRLDRLYHAERSLEQGAITGAQDRATSSPNLWAGQAGARDRYFL